MVTSGARHEYVCPSASEITMPDIYKRDQYQQSHSTAYKNESQTELGYKFGYACIISIQYIYALTKQPTCMLIYKTFKL